MTETIQAIEGTAPVDEKDQPIAVLVEHNPKAVIASAEKRDALLEHVRKEVAEQKPDLTTAAGRDACRAFAAKITRTKTALDKARKEVTAQARALIKQVNEDANGTIDTLDELAKEARKPLTDWEKAEEDRLEECGSALKRAAAIVIVEVGTTAAVIAERLAEMQAWEIDPDRYQGMTEAAEKGRAHAIEVLTAAHERAVKAEADAAELERLRAEAREREQREAEERRKREEAEAAEAKRIADERAEAERKEREAREAQEAAQRAREAEERRAEEARLAAERAAAEAAAKAKRQAEQAAADALAEQERKHREEQERIQREAREAQERAEAAERREREAQEARERAEREAREEEERRLADVARRTALKGDAKRALMAIEGVGLTDEAAREIVLAIIAGDIPHVRLDLTADPLPQPEPEAPAPSQEKPARKGRAAKQEATLV